MQGGTFRTVNEIATSSLQTLVSLLRHIGSVERVHAEWTPLCQMKWT
jgi:hypothetical protein